MRALDKKLLRDFRRLWAQALAIALVLACGVAILLTTYGMYGALEDTRSAYYERNRFADVFADANRVPKSRAMMACIISSGAEPPAQVYRSRLITYNRRSSSQSPSIVSKSS